MTTIASRRRVPKQEGRREGFALLAAIVLLMWIVEVINTLDNNQLDHDGLYARNLARLWGILTFPFIHASFAHLIDNTIPFVFLGAIIAMRGAARLGFITGFVIVVGGIGTWLISPAGIPTIGASGVVFGYAGYLLTRGVFDRRVLELLTGALVAIVWGAALLSSLVPHHGVSWEGHLCGGAAGVLAAWLLASRDGHPRGRRGRRLVGTAPAVPSAR